jgi:hypothetical protein
VAITAPAPGRAHLGENAKMNPPLNGACHTTLGPGRTRSLCPPRTDSRCFFTRLRRRRMCADPSSALDPRSLASATLLRVRTAGLFEVRHRPTTSATALRRTSTTRSCIFLAGRRPQPSSVSPGHAEPPEEVVTELRAARVPSRSPRRPFPLLAQDCGRSMRSPTRHLREVF